MKLKSNILFKNKKINFYFWKLNKKIFLWFFISWLFICILMLTPTILSSPKNKNIRVPFFTNNSMHWIETKKNNPDALNEEFYGLSWILQFTTYGFFAFIYYSIFFIVMFNKNLNNEVKTGSMYNWISLPIKRASIFLRKLFNIHLMVILFFAISFFINFIAMMSGTYRKEDVGYFIVYSICFYLFIFFMLSVFSIIHICFLDKTSFPVAISSVFLVYILVIFILNAIYNYEPSNASTLKFSKYINPVNLIINPTKTTNNFEKTLVFIKDSKTITTIKYNSREVIQIWKAFLFPITQLLIIFFSNYLNIILFKKANLNI